MWSDSSSSKMAYGNQWMNPTFYKNMTNEQVDWASLAQQWIKMKETSPAISPEQQVKIPLPEQSLHKLGQHVDVVPQNLSNVAAVTNKLYSDHNIARPLTRNNIEKPRTWNTWTWQQQQQSNWASTSMAPPTKAPIIESVNSLRPYFVPPILSELPPSFPMMTLNTPFPPNNYRAMPNTTVPPPSESDQLNKLNVISKVDDKTQDPSFIDTAKRKQLPAWIREGLEKMEREKQRRKIEQLFDEPNYSNSMNDNFIQELHSSPIHFDHETQMVDDDIEHHVSSNYINEPRKTEFVQNDPSPLIPRKTKAQIWEDTMLSLRKILTKLLMDVTNDMMLSVIKEVLKTTVQTDIQEYQSQTSLAGKLGLGVYGSETESSDESDKDSHKQLKQESNEAIQERILKRQHEFSNIEARILKELDQLEDKEKLVRSKFDNSVKMSEETNDIGRQVVENIRTRGNNEDVGSNKKIEKSHDTVKNELPNDLNIKNGQKIKKSKSKRSSSSSMSSSSNDSTKSNNTNSKIYNYKKNNKVQSKSSNKKILKYSVKIKRRARSRTKSRSRSIHSSRSHSKYYDRRSTHNFRSRRSRSPLARHSYSRKYKSKQNSSSSSNESRTNKHRYRQ